MRAHAGLLAGLLGPQLRELALDGRGADGRHGRRHRRRSRATARRPPRGPTCRPRTGAARRPGASTRRAAAARCATTPPPRPGAGSWCRRRAWRRAAASRRPRRAAAPNAVPYWKSMLTVRIWIALRGTLARTAARCPRPAGSAAPARSARAARPRVGEQQVRHALELDRDLGDALRQPLAGAQVERHAGPAPVVDLQARRDEGLGVGVGRDARPPRDSRATALPSTWPARVLAAHDVGRPQRPARHEHLDVLVADRLGLERRRRLHRHEPAAAACGSARCRAARRPPRRSGRGPRCRSPRPP